MAPQQPASARDQVRDIVPALVDLSERVLFGEVWERPGLSKRDRSLITCATLIALGREKQLVPLHSDYDSLVPSLRGDAGFG